MCAGLWRRDLVSTLVESKPTLALPMSSSFILRNPETVEARIWDLLNEKLERIQIAFSSVMEEQEDISQLVVGLAGNSFFNEPFSGACDLPDERLVLCPRDI